MLQQGERKARPVKAAAMAAAARGEMSIAGDEQLRARVVALVGASIDEAGALVLGLTGGRNTWAS